MKSEHSVERGLTVALLASFVVIVVLGVIVVRRPGPFDPITFTPSPRSVEYADGTSPTVTGFDGPAVRASQAVPTTGVRCVDHDEPIDVRSNVWWERVDVRGDRVQVVRNRIGELPPGCEPLVFENPIPDAVLDGLDGPQRWTIIGDATPVADGGVTTTWRIEPFWIVP